MKDKYYLRDLIFDDLEAVTRWNYNPQVAQYLPPRPALDMQNQIQWIKQRLIDSSKVSKIIMNGNSMVGMVTGFNFDHENHWCEVGISIGEPVYWGSGISRFAINDLNRCLIEKWNVKYTFCRVFPENQRALSFFKKLGYCETSSKIFNVPAEGFVFLIKEL